MLFRSWSEQCTKDGLNNALRAAGLGESQAEGLLWVGGVLAQASCLPSRFYLIFALKFPVLTLLLP